MGGEIDAAAEGKGELQRLILANQAAYISVLPANRREYIHTLQEMSSVKISYSRVVFSEAAEFGRCWKIKSPPQKTCSGQRA